jgi:outer membrane translocation and assembly module TamA
MTSHPQTFVGQVQVNRGWNLDPAVQFFADGGSGMRGYRLHTFEGSRTVVMNLEQRISLGREILALVSPGIVGFVDVGKAGGGSFRSDAGVGIRFGLPRSSRGLFRLDFAYPLQRDPFGKRRVLVSFSSGQAF